MAEQAWTLRIDGAVSRTVDLSLSELRSLPSVDLDAAFHCDEGWTVPTGTWRGVVARDLLALAAPLPGARYVTAGAGEYTVLLPLDQLVEGRALLALERDARALEPGRGGPVRLIVPEATCCYSVKGLDRLSLTVEAVPTSGETLSRARVDASPFRRAAAVVRGEGMDEAQLQALVSDIEVMLPREVGSPGAAAATAEVLLDLMEQRFGDRLPKGRRYLERLEPLAAELGAVLGATGAADRREALLNFVRRCAGVYADEALPWRYRLLAHHWAGTAVAAACTETGEILVPPNLDGRPGAPFWLEF